MSISRSAPPRKISAKRLAALGGSLPSRTVRPSGKRPKARKKRTAAEEREKFEREYGSRERVEWVKLQKCVACGLRSTPGFSDNAHVATGGASRKADARFIVPLCSPHLIMSPQFVARAAPTEGCHRELHRIGQKSFERKHNINLVALAADTERRWRVHTGATE